MNATSWEILTLDSNRADFGTLRQRIMDVRSRERPRDKLFLSVDTSFFRSNEVIFTFLPRNESEARTFVTNIVPFFLHNFHEDLLKEIFHSDAINRGKALIWNAETREIESADDAYLNNTGDGIDDFDMLDAMGIEDDGINDSNPQRERVERLFYGEESDSIGTLFTNNQNGGPSNGGPNQISASTTSFSTPIANDNIQSGRYLGVGNHSVGGQSSGTTFTNEEASLQIINLTEGFRNLERMFMAVMQQQGIPIPTINPQTVLANTAHQQTIVQPTPTPTQNTMEQQQTPDHVNDDTIMENTFDETVDQCEALANQDNK